MLRKLKKHFIVPGISTTKKSKKIVFFAALTKLNINGDSVTTFYELIT